MNKNTFEQFLQDKHAEQYVGLDDEMGENFDEWLQDLSADEWIDYGDKFKKLQPPIDPKLARSSLDCLARMRSAIERTLLFVQSDGPNKFGYVPSDLILQLKKSISEAEKK